MNPFILRHLAGEKSGRFPVWFMRQAGRYLPEYMKVREEFSFWEMVTKPEVAAKVSLLPIERFPLDGCILFSDILTPPYGFGVEIFMKEKQGPTLAKPLTDLAGYKIFRDFNPERHTAFVGEALGLLRSKLSHEKTLLGFAGAPWTLTSYLCGENEMDRWNRLSSWLQGSPEKLTEALKDVAAMTVAYLLYQKEKGAQTVQLFDTWLGEMPIGFFKEFYKPVLVDIFASLRKAGVPSIYFAKQAHHLDRELADIGADVLSVDSLVPLATWDTILPKSMALQGNLDPRTLLTDEPTVRRKTRFLVQEAQKLSRPVIINLGHGVLPGAPVQNVRAFIEEAQALWV